MFRAEGVGCGVTSATPHCTAASNALGVGAVSSHRARILAELAERKFSVHGSCKALMSQSGGGRVGSSVPRFVHEVAIIAGQPAEPVDHRLLAFLPRQAVNDGKLHRAAEHGALMLVPARGDARWK